MLVQRLLLTFVSLLSASALAQAQRGMSITYGSPEWNKDSGKIDSAYLIMRDKNSGQMVQVQLEETEPDSSEFSGQFSIAIGKDAKVNPEIFIPPKELRGSERNSAKTLEMVRDGKLTAKPVVWKKNDRGQALLDVYDTKAQADAAAKAYKAEQKTADELEKTKRLKPLASEATLAAAAAAEKQRALQKMAADAAKQATDRIRLEQIEKQKAAEREAAMKALSEQQKEDRRMKASALAAEAMAMFQNGDFVTAEKKFKEAVELNPEDTSYYFKYGVTLYRLEKFNEALVMLKLAQVAPEVEVERRYFIAMTHYRLKELDAAIANFTPVAKSNNPMLGPAASFYRGIVYFTQEKFESAKSDFERVIDTSSDPRMDEQAESYLDQIAAALAFKKMKENKFTFLGTLGAMYDSNVLLAQDSTDQGSATKIADFRLLTMLDLEYRPIYEQKHELSAKINLTMINSLKDEAARADPYLTSFALPYSYKGTVGSKGLKFTAKPSYEVLYMDPTGSGTKSNTMSSPVMLFDTTVIMNPTWFSGYSFEYRLDDMMTVDSVGVNNYDGPRYSLKTAQTLFLDQAKKEAFIANLGYVLMAAEGDDKKYKRIEGGVMYSLPVKWEASWNVGLSLYKVDYNKAAIERNDFNTTFTTGLTKPINDWLIWGLNGSYTKNDSNIEVNEYSKFSLMTTATFTNVF